MGSIVAIDTAPPWRRNRQSGKLRPLFLYVVGSPVSKQPVKMEGKRAFPTTKGWILSQNDSQNKPLESGDAMVKKKDPASSKSKMKSGSPNSEKGIDFEKALAEAENVVMKLESGELGLADSLDQYELGIKRIKQCHQSLKDAQRRVSLLSGVTEDGRGITEPFDEQEAEADAESDAADQWEDEQGEDEEWDEEDEDEDDLEDQTSVDESPGLF